MATVDDLIKGVQGLKGEDLERMMAAFGLQLGEKRESGGQSSSGSLSGSGSLAPVPRVGIFSGEDGKTSEVSFSQWKFEIRGLQTDNLYSSGAIMQAVRRSLRGRAADIVLRLKAETGVKEVIAKLEQIFGNVLPAENVLELFYVARQDGRESVAAWACRIEELLAQLREKKAVAAGAEESMLRTKFYSGLNSVAVRNAIRHRFDTEATYAELLKAARVAELEAPVRSHQATVGDNQLSAVLSSMEALTARLDGLERKMSELGPSTQDVRGSGGQLFRGQCYGCGQAGHPVARCPLNSQAGLRMAGQPSANRGGQV
mgnify:CR=1 FL=1